MSGGFTQDDGETRFAVMLGFFGQGVAGDGVDRRVRSTHYLGSDQQIDVAEFLALKGKWKKVNTDHQKKLADIKAGLPLPKDPAQFGRSQKKPFLALSWQGAPSARLHDWLF